ncbi:hypothetical protein EC957_008487 [Mortierella hygrophila]|uniref:Uncharacterized protein n=1 Tax=Mortierella hygrophila TaxID=979708 RepID=A0A9P6EW59_9FUNG|nr:hypothetical protein EC957_008487 [Mortierella hygrophila]
MAIVRSRTYQIKPIADIMLRSKINPKEARKQLHAEDFKLLKKQETEEMDKDYEREQAWGYSADDVERWNEKEETRKE